MAFERLSGQFIHEGGTGMGEPESASPSARPENGSSRRRIMEILTRPAAAPAAALSAAGLAEVADRARQRRPSKVERSSITPEIIVEQEKKLLSEVKELFEKQGIDLASSKLTQADRKKLEPLMGRINKGINSFYENKDLADFYKHLLQAGLVFQGAKEGMQAFSGKAPRRSFLGALGFGVAAAWGEFLAEKQKLLSFSRSPK